MTDEPIGSDPAPEPAPEPPAPPTDPIEEVRA